MSAAVSTLVPRAPPRSTSSGFVRAVSRSALAAATESSATNVRAVGPTSSSFSPSSPALSAANRARVFLYTLCSAPLSRSAPRSVARAPTFMPRYSVTKTALASLSFVAISSTIATFSARGFSISMHTSSHMVSWRLAWGASTTQETCVGRAPRSAGPGPITHPEGGPTVCGEQPSGLNPTMLPGRQSSSYPSSRAAAWCTCLCIWARVIVPWCSTTCRPRPSSSAHSRHADATGSSQRNDPARHAVGDDLGDELDPRVVELLGDPPQVGVAQRLAPDVDPQQPRRVPPRRRQVHARSPGPGAPRASASRSIERRTLAISRSAISPSIASISSSLVAKW